MRTKPKRPSERIAVRRGQVYRIPRNGVPARHVRIAGVSKGATADGAQPIATYYEVTRSGKRKGPRIIVLSRTAAGKPDRTAPNVVAHWLTWDRERSLWVMGAPFELVEELS